MARLGRFFGRLRKLWWLVPLVWLALALVGARALPSLSNTTKADSAYLPANTAPLIAQRYLSHIGKASSGHGTQFIVVIQGKGPLTAAERTQFASRLHNIAAATRTGPAPAHGASPFVSKDGRTDFGVVSIHLAKGKSVAAEVSHIKTTLGRLGPGVSVGVTGDAPLQSDYQAASLSALSRTLKLTVILIVLIMLLVFRSPVAPLVPLFAIGTSYILTSGIVAWLGLRGFPVSQFTQIFLVAIMFGAGTDYGILLLSRFREELARQGDTAAAMETTMERVGATALVSALTLVLAFGAVYFARFNLYQSGVGVAVGMVMVGITTLLVVPAILTGLGGRLFWPYNPLHAKHATAAHSGSRNWQRVASWATRKPAYALLPLAILAFLAALGPGALSFNDLQQLPPTTPSVEAFSRMEQGFGSGQVLPMNVVLYDAHGNFRTPQGMQALAAVTRRLDALKSVKSVDGPTQPLGQPLTALEVTTQAHQAANGVRAMQSALDQLASGLAQGAGEGRVFAASVPKAVAGAHQLTVASDLLVSGLGKEQSGNVALDQASLALWQGLMRMDQGAAKLATAAGRLSSASGRLAQGSAALAKGAKTDASGLVSAAQGASALAKGSQSLASGLAQAQQGLSQLELAAKGLRQDDPALAKDPRYQALVAGLSREGAALTKLHAGAGGVASGLGRESVGLQSAAAGTTRLSQAAGQVASGTQQMQTGLLALSQAVTRLSAALASAQKGAGQLAAGEHRVSAGGAQLSAGAAKLSKGMGQFASGLSSGTGKTSTLVSGLGRASSGAKTVAVDLGKLGTLFLTPLGTQSHGQVLIPASVLHSSQFRPVLAAYVSPGGHVATLTVILATNPYGNAAMADLGGIQAAAAQGLHGTAFSAASVRIAGTTAIDQSLNTLSHQDFGRTALLVLAVIGIMLILLLRSVPAALYLLGIVTLNYFATVRLAHWLSASVMHSGNLSWSTPFFSFLLLVALGVDYLIFYTSRFREEERLGVRDGLVQSARMAGPVVLSAAAIMAGTFGSLTVTGVASLAEIGSVVVIGLALDTFVIMGILVPAGLRVLGPILHWPFPGRAPAETAGAAVEA